MVDISGPQSENTPSRDEGSGGGSVPPSGLLGLGSLAGNARLTQVIQSQVGVLPDLDEQSLPLPGQVQEAERQAREEAPSVGELGALPGPVQEFARANVDQPRVDNEVRDLQAGEAGVDGGDQDQAPGPAPAPEPQGGAPAPKGRWQRFKEGVSSVGTSIGGALSTAGNAIGGFFSSVWKTIKSPFATREARRDTGRTTNTVLSTATGGLVGASLAPQTTGEGLGILGSHLPGQMGQTVSDTGSNVSSAGGTALEIAHTVGSIVGIFFSAIKAALDTKSLISSIRVYRSLKKARERARQRGFDDQVVQAVSYAMEQKYKKIFRRAAGAALALAALGTSLAVLISNPVGAGIAALIIAGAGVAWGIWKIYHLYQKWKTRGTKRKQMAGLLYDKAKSGDTLARNALTALGLNVQQVIGSNDEDGPALIARKLKST